MTGSIGLAVGTSIALSNRLWIRMLIVPALAIMAYATALRVNLMFLSDEPAKTLFWKADMGHWFDLASSSVPMALLFTLSHHILLRHRASRKLRIILVGILFASLGAALGCLDLLLRYNDGDIWLVYRPSEWLHGAAFGAMQFVSIVAALVLDRKMRARLDPPPPTPQPSA